jgi:hypothetical protein
MLTYKTKAKPTSLGASAGHLDPHLKQRLHVGNAVSIVQLNSYLRQYPAS